MVCDNLPVSSRRCSALYTHAAVYQTLLCSSHCVACCRSLQTDYPLCWTDLLQYHTRKQMLFPLSTALLIFSLMVAAFKKSTDLQFLSVCWENSHCYACGEPVCQDLLENTQADPLSDLRYVSYVFQSFTPLYARQYTLITLTPIRLSPVYIIQSPSPLYVKTVLCIRQSSSDCVPCITCMLLESESLMFSIFVSHTSLICLLQSVPMIEHPKQDSLASLSGSKVYIKRFTSIVHRPKSTPNMIRNHHKSCKRLATSSSLPCLPSKSSNLSNSS